MPVEARGSSNYAAPPSLAVRITFNNNRHSGPIADLISLAFVTECIMKIL